jgi:hypothetical protein
MSRHEGLLWIAVIVFFLSFLVPGFVFKGEPAFILAALVIGLFTGLTLVKMSEGKWPNT